MLSLDGNLSENWRRFKQHFDIYLLASGKKNAAEDVKVALLLNLAGEEAQEVFNTFTFAEESEAKKIDVVCQKFSAYCNPRKNVIYERYAFWQCSQEDSNIDQ